MIITNALFLLWLLLSRQNIETQGIVLVAKAYAILFFIQGMIMLIMSGTIHYEGNAKVSWKVFFRSGIYIMCSSVIYFAFLRADNFFVEEYCEPVTLGNYVQCGK